MERTRPNIHVTPGDPAFSVSFCLTWQVEQARNVFIPNLCSMFFFVLVASHGTRDRQFREYTLFNLFKHGKVVKDFWSTRVASGTTITYVYEREKDSFFFVVVADWGCAVSRGSKKTLL